MADPESPTATQQPLQTSPQTPLKPDAFLMPEAQKIAEIAKSFAHIMDVLGLDLTDDSLRETPQRVARMWVRELFAGLNPENAPRVTEFDNKYRYNQMLVEKNIAFTSACEHHFMPMLGKAHVGYISNGRVIGLSKINRIVDYYARRPQVQERATLQILSHLQRALGTEDVAVVIEAKHLCVSTRGIGHPDSSTTTMEYAGQFMADRSLQHDFLALIGRDSL